MSCRPASLSERKASPSQTKALQEIVRSSKDYPAGTSVTRIDHISESSEPDEASGKPVGLIPMKPCILRPGAVSSEYSRGSTFDNQRGSRSSEESSVSFKRCLEEGYGLSEANLGKPSRFSLRKLLNFLRFDPASRRIRTAMWTVVCLGILILAVYSLYSTLFSGNLLFSSVTSTGTGIPAPATTYYNTTTSRTSTPPVDNITVVSTNQTMATNSSSNFGNTNASASPPNKSCTLPAFVCQVIGFFKHLGH